MNMIPIYKPYLTEENLHYARRALESTWISSKGEYLYRLEEKIKSLFGVSYVLLTNNGTSANHLMAKSLQTLGYGKAKNIIVPNSVYVAAWNPFYYDNLYTINNTDTDEETWNMNLDHLDKMSYDHDTVLLVHNLGNPLDVTKLINKYPNLNFIEDNCEGFTATDSDGNLTGTQSLCSTLSFYGNKIVTSGEGGALLTNNKDIYEYARLIWGQGQSNKKFIHTEFGYNYRMTNIQAAILLGQLNFSLYDILYKKERVWNSYHELRGIKNIRFQKVEKNAVPSKWMVGIRFIGNKDYSFAEKFFNYHKIETRPFFYPMNYHSQFSGKWKNMKTADLLSKEIILFPSYPGLIKQELEYIKECIRIYAEVAMKK